MFQALTTILFLQLLPCGWRHLCGRGSRPSRHTSSCSSSRDLQQPEQDCRGQPTKQRNWLTLQLLAIYMFFPLISLYINIAAVGSTHRVHPSLDGQQVWHPVAEPRSKVLWVDCHKTLTLKTKTGDDKTVNWPSTNSNGSCDVIWPTSDLLIVLICWITVAVFWHVNFGSVHLSCFFAVFEKYLVKNFILSSVWELLLNYPAA